MNDDLVERCKELLEWSSTGLLHGGSGGRVRALANKLRKKIPINEMTALSLAEIETKTDAMREVIAHANNVDRADAAEARANQFQRERAELFDKLNGTPCAEVRWQQERDDLLAREAQLREALENAREFIDGQIDVVDGSYGKPAPNRAMVLAQEIDAALTAAERVRSLNAEQRGKDQ